MTETSGSLEGNQSKNKRLVSHLSCVSEYLLEVALTVELGPKLESREVLMKISTQLNYTLRYKVEIMMTDSSFWTPAV